MDHSFHRQESDSPQHPSGILASLQIFDRILTRLARLIQLTEEEQRDAGIYIGDQRYR